MSKTKQLRQAKILAEINDTPSLRITELARRNHVSTETICRDLGALTINFLHQYFVDYAILGASSISAEGPSDALIDCGTVYSAMSQRAAATLVVADHSKFGMTFPSRYAL